MQFHNRDAASQADLQAISLIFCRYLPLLVICTLLCACASLGEKLQAPQVSLVSIKPLKIGLRQQHFRLRLRVKNPNSVDLPIRGMRYTLLLNDREFTKGNSNQAITVPANGETQFEIEIATQLRKLLRNLKPMSGGDVTYKLSGEVELEQPKMTAPFNYHGKIAF